MPSSPIAPVICLVRRFRPRRVIALSLVSALVGLPVPGLAESGPGASSAGAQTIRTEGIPLTTHLREALANRAKLTVDAGKFASVRALDAARFQSAATTTPAKKSRKKLWIIVGAIVVVGVVAALASGDDCPEPNPNDNRVGLVNGCPV